MTPKVKSFEKCLSGFCDWTPNYVSWPNLVKIGRCEVAERTSGIWIRPTTQKVGLRGTRPSPHFAQNGLIAPKFPWTLSPLDMSTLYRIWSGSQLRHFHSPGGLSGVWWLQWKPTFFQCTLIYFCQYNPGEIPGLQIHQSRIPGLRKGIRDWNLYSEASETEISAKAIENSRSGIRGKWGSLNSQLGILKTSGLLKIFVRNFDKILQNSPHLLL